MKKTIIVLRDELFNQATYDRFIPLNKEFNFKFLLPEKHKYPINEIGMELLYSPTNTDMFDAITKNDIMRKLLHHRINREFLNFDSQVGNASIIQTEETFNWYTKQAIKHKARHKYKIVCTVWENIPFIKGYKSQYEIGHILSTKTGIGKKLNNNYYKDERVLLKKNIDLFLAVSTSAKEALITEGYDEKTIRVIKPLIDTNQFKYETKSYDLMKKYGIKKDELVIGTQARLVWEKGVYDFIYAANKLLHDPELKNKKLKFFILGKGELENKIRALIKDLRIENKVIIEASFLPYNELPKYHNLFDIFSLNSLPTTFWQEQIGQALIDSMSTEKAVVAARSGAIPEVVGQAALLSQPGDMHDIAEKLKIFINNEQMRKEYAKKARQWVESQYSKEIINNQLINIYKSIL